MLTCYLQFLSPTMGNSIDPCHSNDKRAARSLVPKESPSMVSEPSILGRGRRLEAQFEETMDGFERMATSLHELHREQEAGWRRTEAKFDALKKLILDLSLPSKGRSMATTDANSGSCCSTDFDQLECNLSPMQKTEELELPHVEGPRSYSFESRERGWDVQRSTAATNEQSDSFESHVREREVRLDTSEIMPLPHNLKSTKVNDINYESYFLNFSHNSVLKLSKIVDDGLIEQYSGVVVEQHSGVVEDALAFSEKEFGNYGNFSLDFCVDANVGGRHDHCQLKGMETESLSTARRNVPMKKLADTLNMIRNLTRRPVPFSKPIMKMKHMVVLVDSCRVFKGGGMARVTQMHVQHGEVTGGNLGTQFDLDEGRLQMVTRGLGADECDGVFEFVDVVVQTLCGLNVKKDQDPPLMFICPTYGIMMKDHVAAASGQTYDYPHPKSYSQGADIKMGISSKFGPLNSEISMEDIKEVSATEEETDAISWPVQREIHPKVVSLCKGARVDNLGNWADYITKLRGLGNKYREFVGLMTKKKEISDEVSAGVLNEYRGIDGKNVHMDEKAAASVLTVPLAGRMKAHQLSDIGWLMSIWFPKPMVKMKLRAVEMANFISDKAMSRSIVVASCHELEVAEGSTFQEEVPSHSLHPTSSMLAEGSSSLTSDFSCSSIMGMETIFEWQLRSEVSSIHSRGRNIVEEFSCCCISFTTTFIHVVDVEQYCHEGLLIGATNTDTIPLLP